LRPAAADAADADLADVARIVERADLQLQRTVGILVLAHRDVVEDRLEQSREILLGVLHILGRPALEGRGVNHREIELRLGGAQLVEEIEGLVDDPVGARARTVDLVHDDDRLQAEGAAPCA
jgi:hypothetical protein